jgi:hypothetical protein
MIVWTLALLMVIAIGAFLVYGTLDREQEETNKTKPA